jgi:phosphoribosylglycinamide formyltransferase-1
MSAARTVPLGVLISGSGTNLQAIIDAIEAKRLAAEIRVVISNRREAFGLERARRHGIEALYLDHRGYADREAYDRALLEILERRGVELVILAGFMRLLSPLFVRAYRHRIMNIHPALLPAFPGLHVQKRALEYGVRFSGCTVHFVDEQCDEGPIIIQAVVPVLQDDTVESLAARILKEEHRIYPRAIQLYSEGRLRVEGRRVIVEGLAACGDEALIHPPLTG